MSAPSSRIVYFLVCDSARAEANSKQLYIGVYSRALIAEGTFPVFLPSLVLVACLKPVKAKETMTVRIRIPGMESAIEPVEVLLESKNPMDSVTYHYVLTPCVLPAPGTLRVDFAFEDGTAETGEIELVDRSTYKLMKW